jgi:RelA/SpoT family (p)ppGpp synthetase
MQRKGVSIEEVLDLLAVRILLQSPLDCYKVLGLMHLSFTPLISRFKDYIAVPKENGYKTIHTTLFSEDGILEAQIRTQEMHHLAEYGVAAHWKYKGGDSDAVNLEWLESLHYEHESVKDFYALAKCDLYSEDITVFSPDGDPYNLPKGSTALDFAYAVHSKIGDNAVDAWINKHNASLLTILNNGDMIHIVKDDNVHLHCSWIDTVKTAKAQEGIRAICKARLIENNVLTAYAILATFFKQERETIKMLVETLGLRDSLYRLPDDKQYYNEAIDKIVAYTGAKEVRVWELFKKGYKKPKVKVLEHFHFLTNKSLDKVGFDYCCHPKVGDDIVAFYENSKAIIHHKLCKHAYSKLGKQEEMLYVSWTKSKHAHYSIIVSLQNQKGILADLLAKLSQLNLNILSIELGIRRSEEAEYCKIEVESVTARKQFFKDQISKKFNLIELTSLDDAYNK